MIAVGLVDVNGLRQIRSESPGEFGLALITAAVVVLIGVEQASCWRSCSPCFDMFVTAIDLTLRC